MRYVLALSLALILAGCGGTDWSDSWHDAAGKEVDKQVVSTVRPDCLESVVVLYLGWPLGTATSFGSDAGRYYARNPNGWANTVMPFQESVHLPVSARDTGYRQGGIELWIWGNARKFVFVVNGDDVELWPRLEEQIDARDSQPPFRNQHFALAPKCEVPSCCLSRRVVRSRDYDGEEEE